MKASSPKISSRKPDRPIVSALDAAGLLEEKLWGPGELAQFLGVQRGTVFSWISRKVDLPPFIRIASCVRFRPEAVKEWVRTQEAARQKRNFEL